MPLRVCEECAHSISDQAAVCPQCGMPQQSTVSHSSPCKSTPAPLSDERQPFRQRTTLLAIFGLIILAAIFERGGGGGQRPNPNPLPKVNSISSPAPEGAADLSPELKETADSVFHELRRRHFKELLDLQMRFKTPDPPDALINDRPADAVKIEWKGRGRVVDLTIRNDNGYDVKNLAVVCYLPGGSAAMRTMPGSIPAHQAKQFSGDFGADAVLGCLVLTAAAAGHS